MITHLDDQIGATETDPLLPVLVHEFRNSVASVRGCVETLRARGDTLPEQVRDALSDVVLRQADRLEWMVSALELAEGPGAERCFEWVDPVPVAAEAGRRAGVEVQGQVPESVPFLGDGRRLAIALEGLFLALAEDQPEVSARMLGPRTLVVASPLASLEDDRRRWKLLLAARVLQEERCRLTLRHGEDGTRAEVSFGLA